MLHTSTHVAPDDATMAWDVQSRRVRQTQSKLDAKLAAYSQHVSEAVSRTERDISARGSAPADAVAVDMTGEGHAVMEAELQALLAQYADEIEELAASMNDPMLPPSQTQMHTVQRHRELLVEFERDFFRSKTNLRHALDRQQLLGHVREDIDNYRATHEDETQAFLNEREHLDRSHRMLDDTLDQAYATQSEFRAQREQLGGTLARLTHIAAQIPGLDSVIGMISRRRRRDTIILAVVMGVCVVVLLLVGVRR